MTQPTIEQVFRKNAKGWMTLDGVLGAAVGRHEDEVCVFVYVLEKTEALERMIPGEVEGYRVRVEETGALAPLAQIARAGDRRRKR